MNRTLPQWTHIRITARHAYYALVGLLCLLNLVFAVRLVYAWREARSGDAVRLEAREAEYRAMQLKTKPLRGLDRKIARAQTDEQAFYAKRFPATYSTVLTELGALAIKNNVLLASGQYTQGKLDQGVYRIQMNVNLTGDYAPIVRFINGLERDKIFFLIDGIALNGQQNGIVNLRLLLTTYLQAPVENATGPVQPSPQPVHAAATHPDAHSRSVDAHPDLAALQPPAAAHSISERR